ncbi:protein AAR2 homolog [Acanthaster planci]|uniref:Protein AAR2 homolog n=1 Tax=Acanthaster planci TaxID=133434 RepID=A0A8B7ZUI0_ACAPL|nr:protein AAR2 homolog [Acanthaster planci]XP_022109075.1 protein AAR2 homolog [Acanthaster planci]
MAESSNAASMDQDTARQLFEEGATLLFLNVPLGTEFGIDYNTWNTAEHFKGVKMIPPGVHFVYYSAVNVRDRCTAPRMGFFHCFRRREVMVLSWSKRDEDAVEHFLEDGEEAEYRGRLREFDPCLGSYPYESLKKWVSLTSHITENSVKDLMPSCQRIYSAPQLIADDETRTTAERAKLAENQRLEHPEGSGVSAEDLLPRMHSKPGTEIRFSPIPDKNYPVGASPAEITKYSMDLSYTLENMLRTRYPDRPTAILGEIQFAFICFLVGQVYDGFEQWKRLVHILCASEESLVAHQDLYASFITALHFQLKEVPADFFIDIVSTDNFLTTTLREFFTNLQGAEVGQPLKVKGRRFKESLTKRFRWDFDALPDEDAPVVVQL